ncbi:hypothetical protein ACFFJN_02200 [Erwinia mallotivora]|uniref:hypothetical protein n=1 Tax=Erwinia mallotivora TaxID=69222 RepID=UPI0035E66660
MKMSTRNLIHRSSPASAVAARAVKSTITSLSLATTSGRELSLVRQIYDAIPEVNSERVHAMQAALNNHELSLDSLLLARAMMAYYRR